MDFTLSTYVEFIKTLKKQGFCFLTFSDFKSNPSGKAVLLRHDVDRLPLNSLEFARIQADLGIRGAYYFRILPESFDEKIIKEIYSLGHEIGYHYEDFDLMVKRVRARKVTEKELAEQAIDSFSKNLERIRQLAPVKSICMHGSPLSNWDNRLLWKYYDYKDFGIEIEPFFDIDFTKRLYLTDTGRSWSGSNVSIRDKASGIGYRVSGEEGFKEWVVKPTVGSLMNMTSEGIELQNKYKVHTTLALIKAVENESFPESAMFTFHPQRWSDMVYPWVKELLFQKIKNTGKFVLIKLRS